MMSVMLEASFWPRDDLSYPGHLKLKLKSLRDLCLSCIGHNLDHITRVSQYLAPSHKELLLERLANHDLFSPKYLPHVTYHLSSPALQKLVLYKCSQVTDNFLRQLAASKCQLQQLSIHMCSSVTDVGVQYITREQKQLQSLALRKMTISDRGLASIKSSVLSILNLRGCSKLTSQGLKKVTEANPEIQSLNLVDCSKLDENAVLYVAQNLKDKLDVLDVADHHPLSDTGLAALAEHCPNLTQLNITGCNKITPSGMQKFLEGCRKLCVLDLSYVRLQDHNSFSCLMSLPSDTLQELSLCGLMLAAEDRPLLLQVLNRLSSLNKVRLCGIPAVDDDTLEEILSVLGPRLELLDLAGTTTSPLTNYALRSVVRHCTSLQGIVLTHLKDITGTPLTTLLEDSRRAAQLTTLMLSCKNLDIDTMLRIPASCPNLCRLDVSGVIGVEDELLFLLASHCSQLVHGNFKGCKKLTDAGVCELARCCPLSSLVVSGAGLLTDCSVFSLAAHCPYLEELYISGCSRITPSAVRYLMDAVIPRIYVAHRLPNAELNQLMAHDLDTGNYVQTT